MCGFQSSTNMKNSESSERRLLVIQSALQPRPGNRANCSRRATCHRRNRLRPRGGPYDAQNGAMRICAQLAQSRAVTKTPGDWPAGYAVMATAFAVMQAMPTDAPALGVPQAEEVESR